MATTDTHRTAMIARRVDLRSSASSPRHRFVFASCIMVPLSLAIGTPSTADNRDQCIIAHLSGYAADPPRAPAFCQARARVKPEAMCELLGSYVVAVLREDCRHLLAVLLEGHEKCAVLVRDQNGLLGCRARFALHCQIE